MPGNPDQYTPQNRAIIFFGWLSFLISLGGQAPHVPRADTGHACGEPKRNRVDRRTRFVYRSPSSRYYRSQGWQGYAHWLGTSLTTEDVAREQKKLASGFWKKSAAKSHLSYAIPKKSGNIFRVGIFLIASASPHVRPMGVHRTCGEPGEIKLTAMGVELNGSGTARRLRWRGRWT